MPQNAGSANSCVLDIRLSGRISPFSLSHAQGAKLTLHKPTAIFFPTPINGDSDASLVTDSPDRRGSVGWPFQLKTYCLVSDLI